MIRQYIVLSALFATLFASCSKTENVALDYPYILDEEFQGNEKGWAEVDTSSSQTKYFQKLFTDGNGYYATVYFSTFAAPSALATTTNAGMNHDKDYILESSFTFDDTYLNSSDNDPDIPCGIIWDAEDDLNYFKVGVGYSASTQTGLLHVQQVSGGATNNLITPIEISMSSPVANLKVNKTTQSSTLNTIDVIVNGETVTVVDSIDFSNNSPNAGLHTFKGGVVNYHNIRVRQEP